MDYLESQAHKHCMVRLEEMVYLETLAQLDSPGHLGNQATRRERTAWNTGREGNL